MSNKQGVVLHCVGQLLWLFLLWLHLCLVVDMTMVKSSRGGMELWWKNFWGGENEREYKWEGAQVSKRRQVLTKNFFFTLIVIILHLGKKGNNGKTWPFFSSKFNHRQWKKRFKKKKKKHHFNLQRMSWCCKMCGFEGNHIFGVVCIRNWGRNITLGITRICAPWFYVWHIMIVTSCRQFIRLFHHSCLCWWRWCLFYSKHNTTQLLLHIS